MKVVVRLAGGDVLEVIYEDDGSEATSTEVRQYHHDFQGDEIEADPLGGNYETVYPMEVTHGS